MHFWTDYPLSKKEETISNPGFKKIKIISYDGDKYVTIKYRGKIYEIKAGYVFDRNFKNSKVACYSCSKYYKCTKLVRKKLNKM